MDKQIMNCHRCCNRYCNRCYNKHRHEDYGYYRDTLSDYHFDLKYPFNGNSPLSGTFSYICDGRQHFVLDSLVPAKHQVTVYNHGDCPAQIWLYYSEGVFWSRFGKIIQVGETHDFGTVDSLTMVSIRCDSSKCQGGRCNPNNVVDHCIVDYSIS